MEKRMIGISLLLTIALCTTSAAQETEPLKLGVLAQLSGPFQYGGEMVLEGVEYAVEEINSQGGLLGRPLEIVAADTELNADVAVQRATELILDEGVKFFIMASGSHIGAALLPVAEEHNVILFSTLMGADTLTGEQCSRYFFRTAPSTTMHSNALAFWIVMNGYKKVFGIAQDYSFGKAAMSAFTRKLHELDPTVEVVGEQFHPLGAEDLRPLIKDIIAAEPELVFTPNWGADLINLVNQAGELGLKTKFVGYYLNDPVFVGSLNNDADIIGSVGVENYMMAIPTDKNRQFVERYYQAKGEYPSLARAKNYISVDFWAEAVTIAGTDDVDAVINAWEGLIYDGPAGKWHMRACDHQAQVPMWVGEIAKENPFYDHAFVGEASSIPVRFIAVPCEQTGCSGFAR